MSDSVRILARSVLLAFVALAAGLAIAAGGRDAVLDHYAELAKAADSAFSGFSSARGEAFFRAERATDDPELSSCTSCHTADPRNAGETRVGQEIAAMAVSVSPERFTDPAKVEKWFRRNCNTVLGRECTPREKGDFIDFMASQ